MTVGVHILTIKATDIAGNMQNTSVEFVIIDSDNDTRQLMSVFLKGVGARATPFETGKDAINYIKNHAPEIVIIDMVMEKEDSIQIISDIRKAGFQGAVVALSAIDDDSMRKKISYAKCDDFLMKPLRRTEFIHKMEMLYKAKASL